MIKELDNAEIYTMINKLYEDLYSLKVNDPERINIRNKIDELQKIYKSIY